tara:strand:+ start:1078 stop:1344 length:267 start_codon:yes stop_codon:yes gene_type:complete
MGLSLNSWNFLYQIWLDTSKLFHQTCCTDQALEFNKLFIDFKKIKSSKPLNRCRDPMVPKGYKKSWACDGLHDAIALLLSRQEVPGGK